MPADHRDRGHDDGTGALAAGVDDRLVARHAMADLLDCEVDEHDGVLGDDAHQHQHADDDGQADRLRGDGTGATMAPPIESGSENRMVTGCRKLANNSTSTA